MWQPGDPVWFHPHDRHAWRDTRPVPGEVTRLSAHRVFVRLLLRSGATVVRYVKASSLTRRDPEESYDRV